MGLFRFEILPADRIDAWPELQRAHLVSFDGRVYPANIGLTSNVLEIRRTSGESGRLFLPYPVEGEGRPVLCTASLCERSEPYLLSVEIARGRIGLLREQLAIWQQAGMAVPHGFTQTMRESETAFRHAACEQWSDPAAAALTADRAIALCGSAGRQLMESYVRQRLAQRRKRAPHLPLLLSCGLGEAIPAPDWDRPFVSAFNAVELDVAWRNVEPTQGGYDWEITDRQLNWAEQHRLLPLAGPLIDFRERGFPAWVANWEAGLSDVQTFCADYVETVLTRYAGRIRFWEISAAGNLGGVARLNEERRLTLTARAIETARRIDEELYLSIRISQPWGEYQVRGGHRLSPLQFADALARSNVGLNAITLEIAMGYANPGTSYRDRAEVSRLIDTWSILGLPLRIELAMPSRQRPDELADPDWQVDHPQAQGPWGEETQNDWVSDMVLLLMAKPAVTAVGWTHFSDSVPHLFAHAGLLRDDDSVKPTLETLMKFRQCYLPRLRGGEGRSADDPA